MTEFNAKFHKGAFDPQELCDHEGHWKIVKIGENVYEGHCEVCGLVQTEILLVEYWSDHEKEDPYIRIGGKKYRALRSWGNIAPCSECRKVFFETALILWDEKDSSKAIVFCPECSKSIIEKMVDKKEEKP